MAVAFIYIGWRKSDFFTKRKYLSILFGGKLLLLEIPKRHAYQRVSEALLLR